MKKRILILLAILSLLVFVGCKGKQIADTEGSLSESGISDISSFEDSSDVSGGAEQTDSTDSSTTSASETVGADTASSTAATTPPAASSKQPSTSSTSNPAPANITPTGVSLNQNAVTLDIGGTATLTATVSPGNAANKSVTWKSDNEGVATVDGGKITAKAAGNATITVRTSNNMTATCTVKVNAPAAKSAYEKPYDLETILKDAKKYGEGIGLAWDESLSTENCPWEAAINMGAFTTESSLVQVIHSRIDRVKKIAVQNGGVWAENPTFKLFLKPIGNNDYDMYFLMG
jgi:uncharacterized protein YjdB